MKIFKAIIFHAFAVVALTTACSKSNDNSVAKPEASASRELLDTIAHQDSVFFNAFNDRNLDQLSALLSEDLEFYHDLGGVTDLKQNVDAFKRLFDGDRRLRRELVVGSLEVYPIRDYGAIEIGIHRFYATEKGQEEQLSSKAKFLHVWQKKDGAWKITRIISYGHEEYLP